MVESSNKDTSFVANLTDDQVKEIALKARAAMAILDRTYRFKTYASCCVGTDLGLWFKQTGVSISIEWLQSHHFMTLKFSFCFCSKCLMCLPRKSWDKE